MRALTRKQFLSLLARTGAAVAAVPLIAACGGDDDDGGGGTGGPDAAGGGQADCLANGTRNSIGTNHGHTLVVPAADVEAGTERTYDITGTSDHPHTLAVTADHFAMLQEGQPVTITSSFDDGHDHVVMISCA
ncbi:MAG TPA: hypothetical protein VKZ63_10970 [Kofleriaceae bacterium]|nr:hypothetical protein [Kofleriaceae bacterium]